MLRVGLGPGVVAFVYRLFTGLVERSFKSHLWLKLEARLRDMSVTLTEKADAAFHLLCDALGDWWTDDRRKWCAYCGIPMKARCVKGRPIPPQKASGDDLFLYRPPALRESGSRVYRGGSQGAEGVIGRGS